MYKNVNYKKQNNLFFVKCKKQKYYFFAFLRKHFLFNFTNSNTHSLPNQATLFVRLGVQIVQNFR